MNGSGWIVLLVAVIAVALVLWLVRGRNRQSPPTQTFAPAPSETVSPPTPAPPAAQPVPPASEPATSGATDDLLRLKGVGPKIAAILNAEGITRFDQIAAWTDADLAAIDARLGNFAGRPTRDNWVDQARLLASGDVAGYEAKYGKL
ncbi:MAG TPA: hypothetical protein VL918_01405 [Sphingobium sp.]|nr:hypothetical protein [Sphingobium sp.]